MTRNFKKVLIGIGIVSLLLLAEHQIAKAINLFDYSCDAEILGIQKNNINVKITITIPGIVPKAIQGTQVIKPDIYIYSTDGRLITTLINNTGEKILLNDPVVYQSVFQIDYTTPVFIELAKLAGKNIQNLIADVIAGNNDLSYWEIGINLVAKLVFRETVIPATSIEFTI
jgi:hypothetical protein